MMKVSFAIIGCGKVGTTLGKYLSKAGYQAVGFASTQLDAAMQAAKIAGFEDRYFSHSWEAAQQADIIFITTPDGSIEEACQMLVMNNGVREKAVVLHCSGALPSTILSSVKRIGAFAGSMHPLQSFAVAGEDNPFINIMMAIEGDPEAVTTAEAIASDLGAIPFTIKTEGKTLYHASAVVASNYLVTLMSLAFELIAASGVQKSEAFKILKPLVKGTLDNIENVGIPQALTGPIARGDYKTVSAHISLIKDMVPEVLILYEKLGLATVKIARAKGTLSPEAAEKILKIIHN